MSKPMVTACMRSSSESWSPQQQPPHWHSRAGGGAVHSIISGSDLGNNRIVRGLDELRSSPGGTATPPNPRQRCSPSVLKPNAVIIPSRDAVESRQDNPRQTELLFCGRLQVDPEPREPLAGEGLGAFLVVVSCGQREGLAEVSDGIVT